MDIHNSNNNINSVKQTLPAVSDKGVDPLSYFEKDEVFVFVYKKTEKLATALYVVTNLFGESEPMKWALRKKVGELLSFMLGYKDTSSAEYDTFINSIQTRVLEIVSLLEISSRSGLVSPMNFSILKNEFSTLLSHLNNSSKTQTTESTYTTLSKTFFDIPQTPHSVYTFPVGERDGDVKDKKEATAQTPGPAAQAVVPTIFKRNNRQTNILSLLKKKKDLTIKDISVIIKDCSEKTIQRELISLIKSGIIRKIGERRWSRYSLVQPVTNSGLHT